MVRIRMQRLGRRNRPFYRIAAAEQRTRRNGPVIEALGTYDPIEKDPAKQFIINEERVKFWIAKGAQPSDTLRDAFAKRGLVDTAQWEKDRAFDRRKVEKKQAAAAAAPADAKKDEKKA